MTGHPPLADPVPAGRDPRDPQEHDSTAGEYVLGTLTPDAHAAVAEALAHDAVLRAAVYAWQDRLLGLLGRVAPVDAPATLWAGIERRLGATQATALPAAGHAAASNDALFRRLRRWQWTGGLALAASVLFASLLLLRVLQPTADPARYLAVLQSPTDRSTGWVVEAVAGDRVRLLPFAATDLAPAGRTLQFWTKAEGATGPTSLGLVRANEAVELPASTLPAVGARQLFELTLEPEGGSPIGKPTGPVLFIGSTVQL